MRKADARANRQALRSDIAGKLASFTTGGSTGDPLIFDLAKRRVASRVACRQRTSRWWGVSTGDPELAIWGSPVELTRQDWVRSFRDRFLASRLLSAFEMNDATMSHYLDVLERGNYKQLFGYPSAIYQLCLHARKEGRKLRRLPLRVVFVTGEVLFPYQREIIADTLNCPVANGYGGRDSALIAHECPQGGLHVLSDAVIFETVDPQGRPVEVGQPGEIVITDLYSHEAPFIRYATGDIAVISPRRCGCGRALPVLERVEGRSNDTVLAPDGRMINSLALIYSVREVDGIERFRITQKTLTRFSRSTGVHQPVFFLCWRRAHPQRLDPVAASAGDRYLRIPDGTAPGTVGKVPPRRLGIAGGRQCSSDQLNRKTEVRRNLRRIAKPCAKISGVV
jgi:phenylacetate-CoA ligase